MFHAFLKSLGKTTAINLLTALLVFTPPPSFAVPAQAGQNQENTAPTVDQKATDQKTVDKDDKSPAPSKGKPEDAASFGNYLAGRFAESQGDTTHGVEYLRDSLKRDPDNQDVLKSLYRMLVFSGKIDDALPLAKRLEGVKVVDQGSEFTPEMLLAMQSAKAGNFAEADKYLAGLPKTGFNTLLVPMMRAWMKLGMHEIKAPVDAKSLAADGHLLLPQIYLNAALINDLAGFDNDALKQYEAAVKDQKIEPFRAVEVLANFYSRKDMKDKHDKLVSDYVAAHGDSYLTEELLASPANATPKPLVGNATEGAAESIYTIANIFHGIRAPADEVASLQLALYLRPDFTAARFLLASTYELAQDYQSAVDTYQSIDKKSPYYTRGRIRAVYDQIELGHKDTAISMLDSMAHENPHDIDALLAKGDILRIQNKLSEAIDVYNQAESRVKNPQKRDWILYFSRGACYQMNGQWEKAEADMKKALTLDPKEPEVLNYLGYSWLTMRQNIPEAKKMIEEAYDARPEDAHIIDSMGYAYYVTGDFANAEEYFDQALERTPNDPTVNDHLGDTYWQLGRKTEAGYQWERALKDGPDKDTEKDLHKKLKDGLALVQPSKSAEAKKPVKSTEDE